MAAPHPLDGLSLEECEIARQACLASVPTDAVISFREVFLREPLKAELKPFLATEHDGSLTEDTPRPARQARAQYDVIGPDNIPKSTESIVDIKTQKIVSTEVVDAKFQTALTLYEFDNLVDACWKSKIFKQALAEFELPEGFEAIVEPWPYGGMSEDEENRRMFQGLVFAQDKRSGNPDSNFYAYPLPLIPVMDAATQTIIRVQKLATGGKGDGLTGETHAKQVLAHAQPAEYVPELLPNGTRKDLKPIDITQPQGPSFSVNGGLVEWQKWRFRVGFNPREGATIHDVHYDGRSVMYRLSISEMTVPYADARDPFWRKQAFDFGDGGAGNCANNLSLGCDCLGVIKYFDTVLMTQSGKAQVSPSVICLHEQDSGIEWKHTNWRTGRAVVTRRRELVVQFIITLANYEYVFAYKFDLSGGITIETRATGIVSVVNIDPGKTSDYGNVVSPGALAQNHQHIFAVRMDPAIDGSENSVVVEESHRVPINEATNPHGNYYEVQQRLVERAGWFDAEPQNNRVIKIQNRNIKNPISGRPVGYKFTPPPTQTLLADSNCSQFKRATFAQHHVWVTKYKDDELYAAGKHTLQSRREVDGVADAVRRGDEVVDTDVVVWNCFGLTHNPRVEDWPVMPVEIHEIHLKPADFFTANPSIDVPSNRNMASTLTNGANGTNSTHAIDGVNGTNGVNGCCSNGIPAARPLGR